MANLSSGMRKRINTSLSKKSLFFHKRTNKEGKQEYAIQDLQQCIDKDISYQIELPTEKYNRIEDGSLTFVDFVHSPYDNSWKALVHREYLIIDAQHYDHMMFQPIDHHVT
eukprot:UN05440